MTEVPYDPQRHEQLKGLADNEAATHVTRGDREAIRWALGMIESIRRERDAMAAERSRLRRWRERAEQWLRQGEELWR